MEGPDRDLSISIVLRTILCSLLAFKSQVTLRENRHHIRLHPASFTTLCGRFLRTDPAYHLGNGIGFISGP